MTREEFAYNWMKGNGLIAKDGTWLCTTTWCTELLGSIYDLQQQITQLQEKVDESNQAKDY